jgi:hypothetical protein
MFFLSQGALFRRCSFHRNKNSGRGEILIRCVCVALFRNGWSLERNAFLRTFIDARAAFRAGVFVDNCDVVDCDCVRRAHIRACAASDTIVNIDPCWHSFLLQKMQKTRGQVLKTPQKNERQGSDYRSQISSLSRNQTPRPFSEGAARIRGVWRGIDGSLFTSFFRACPTRLEIGLRLG